MPSIRTAKNSELKASQDLINNMTDEQIIHTLAWVLHHTGQENLESFGNQMGITLLPNKPMEQATLLLGFHIDSEGKFERKTEVEIVQGVTPIEWLYLLAKEKNAKLTLDQFLETANSIHITDKLDGVVKEGQLSWFINSGVADAFEPRIAMGRVSDAKLSEFLEEAVEIVFTEMGQNIEHEINKEVLADAVKFSREARDPSQLGAVADWYKYAFEQMTSSQTSASKITLDNDSFWFLWAAPYITGEYPQKGGGRQSR